MKTDQPGKKAGRNSAELVLADGIAADLDADLYLYSGAVYFPSDRKFTDLVRRSRSRTNVLLYLGTFGGSADTAYRVARCLQSNYSDGSVSVLVTEFCKSAGTLIAIGANELVMSDNAELGPLDVQIAKHDSLAGRTSGLTPVQALTTLGEEAFKTFEKCLLDVVRKSKGRVTTATAAMMAVRMTTGLFRPVYAQIEPMRLGEYGRSLLVADDYGTRLNRRAKNLKKDALAQLIAGYPSHEFVIDRMEAQDLFVNVREPSEKEAKLARMLEQEVWGVIQSDQALVRCLSTRAVKPPEESDHDEPGIPDRVAPSPSGRQNGRTPPPGKPNGKPGAGKGRTRERTAHTVGGNGLPRLPSE